MNRTLTLARRWPLVSYFGLTADLPVVAPRGGGVIATLFHGAVNTFVVANNAAGPTLKGWGDALAYGVAALVIGAA
jgi:hypothetical protein